MTESIHQPLLPDDTFIVRWSDQDNQYIATSQRYGSQVSNSDEDPVRALGGLISIIEAVKKKD